MVRWDKADSAWRTDISVSDWAMRIQPVLVSVGMSVGMDTVERVYARMVRRITNGTVSSHIHGRLYECVGKAQCVDHIVPRHLLEALERTEQRDNTVIVDDYDDETNLQASCAYCNEIKNRWEQLRMLKLSTKNSHPGLIDD